MTKQDEATAGAAVGSQVDRQVRPACWDFAMSFLGDPEAPVIEAYVVALEAWADAATAAVHATRQRIIDACGSMLMCPCCGEQFACADDCTFSADCPDEANTMMCLRDAVRA